MMIFSLEYNELKTLIESRFFSRDNRPFCFVFDLRVFLIVLVFSNGNHFVFRRNTRTMNIRVSNFFVNFGV